MRELDALLEGWLERHYNTARNEDQLRFSELLELQDPVLMALLAGRSADNLDSQVISASDYLAMEGRFGTIISQIRSLP